MNSDPRLPKLTVLITHKKYAEAGQLLRDLLSQDPNNASLIAMLAEVELQLDNFDKARQLIDSAIGREPINAWMYYIKARIALEQNQTEEGEALLRESISLDPYDATPFALLGHVRLSRKAYDDALHMADKALRIDPENILALNTRSTALMKLNRKEESFETIEGALREDPTNAYTHANYGWNLLEKGNHKKALVHFTEALKKEPTYKYAQVGMMEALKANNLIYRLFLKYSFWIGNLSAKYQWAVIIGFYLIFRVLTNIARTNKELAPILIPIVYLIALLAFSTWIITPVSNLFLRLSKYGKYLLDDKQKISSNFVGVSLLVAVAGGVLYFIQHDERYLFVVIYGAFMMVPYGVMMRDAKPKYSLKLFAASMALVGLAALVSAFTTGQAFETLATAFLVIFFTFQWVANFLTIKADNR